MICLIRETSDSQDPLVAIDVFINGDDDIYALQIQAKAVSRGLLRYVRRHPDFSDEFIEDMHTITESLVNLITGSYDMQIFLSYEDAEPLYKNVANFVYRHVETFCKKYNFVVEAINKPN